LTNSRRYCSLSLCLICGHIVVAGRRKSTGRKGRQDRAEPADSRGWPGNAKKRKTVGTNLRSN
jgi:hypothetical protein